MSKVKYEVTKANGEVKIVSTLAEARLEVAEGGEYRVIYENEGDKS